MKQNKAYKFRIYPNKAQKILLAKTFGCVRFIYNRMLADKIEHYEKTGEMLSVTPAQYKAEFDWLKEVDSLALANAQINLQAAYKNFFRDKRGGYPKFKSKKEHRFSYTTNRVNNNIRLANGYLTLPKLKNVKIKQHRLIPNGYTLKSVTVSQTPSSKYFVSILFEYEADIKKIEKPDHVVGLDFSIPELYISANNIDANTSHYYELSHSKLAREQRKLSRCTPGSKNYEKQRIKVARVHEKIVNQRNDYLHKKSTQIANAYDAICIEDVSIPEIVNDLPFRPVRRTIYDDAWGKFSSILEYKTEDRGKYLLKADKTFPSSQKCHCCGYIYSELKLSDRKWYCPNCHTWHNRDKNAAFNLKAEGERLLSELLLTS